MDVRDWIFQVELDERRGAEQHHWMRNILLRAQYCEVPSAFTDEAMMDFRFLRPSVFLRSFCAQRMSLSMFRIAAFAARGQCLQWAQLASSQGQQADGGPPRCRKSAQSPKQTHYTEAAKLSVRDPTGHQGIVYRLRMSKYVRSILEEAVHRAKEQLSAGPSQWLIPKPA